MALGDQSSFGVAALTAQTTAGVSSAIEIGGRDIAFQVTVASIGTNVVIRMEGSLDGTSYFNLDQTNADTTLTANGTFGYILSSAPVRYVRLRLVSLSGGTPSVSGFIGAQ
jgi:hypothetical protein